MSPPSHLFHSSSSAVLGSYISGVISGARSSASSWPRGTSFSGLLDRVRKAMRLSSRDWNVKERHNGIRTTLLFSVSPAAGFSAQPKKSNTKILDSCHKESFTSVVQESYTFITLTIKQLLFINTLLFIYLMPNSLSATEEAISTCNIWFFHVCFTLLALFTIWNWSWAAAQDCLFRTPLPCTATQISNIFLIINIKQWFSLQPSFLRC